MQKTQIWKFFYWPVVWILALWPWHVTASSHLSGVIFIRFAGLTVLAYGLMVHILAGKTLKRLGHTPENKSIWPDVLVTSGIYSSMRHPQHLGLILIPLGIALLICTFQALLAAGWTVAAGLFFVLVIEEPECLRKFGKSYCDYMAKTPAFSLGPQAFSQGLRFLKDLKRNPGEG